jgi:hypothetical protein
MSCGRLPLFTNVTCAPLTTVTSLTDTPPFVIVIVAPPVLPPGFGVGERALFPQAVRVSAAAAAHTRSTSLFVDMVLDFYREGRVSGQLLHSAGTPCIHLPLHRLAL